MCCGSTIITSDRYRQVPLVAHKLPIISYAACRYKFIWSAHLVYWIYCFQAAVQSQELYKFQAGTASLTLWPSDGDKLSQYSTSTFQPLGHIKPSGGFSLFLARVRICVDKQGCFEINFGGEKERGQVSSCSKVDSNIFTLHYLCTGDEEKIVFP